MCVPDAKGKQLSLFADDPTLTCYRFGALVTDLDLPAEELWRLYRGRADCENRIKELKYDFGGDCFNLKSFWATEAALLTVMLAYNLMSLFRQSVLRNEAAPGKKAVQHTLKTLRYKLFAKAGYLTKDGRKKIINLAVAMRQRKWFDGLWNKSSTFTPSSQLFPPKPPKIPHFCTESEKNAFIINGCYFLCAM